MEEVGYTARVLMAELNALEKHNATLMGGGYTMLGRVNLYLRIFFKKY